MFIFCISQGLSPLFESKGKERAHFPSITQEWQLWFGRGWVQDACESRAVSARLLKVIAFSLESREY